MRRADSVGRGPERPQSVTVFRRAVRGAPDVVAGEVHVLPAERREMGEQLVRHILDFPQGGDGTLQVARVP